MTGQEERAAYLAGLLTGHRERIASGQRRAVAFGAPVRVLTVSRSGVRVRYPDGHVERLHPEDVRAA